MPETWPQQTRAALNDFYGNPDRDGNGVPDRAWEDANLISMPPPYTMRLAWAPETKVRTIRVHKKAAPSLQRVLLGILAHYGSQEEIERARMDLYGGCYNFRMMRGSPSLSVHSWGCAIDLDPGANRMGRPWGDGMGMMPRPVIDLFEHEGWVWGGRWRTPDAMHFQAAII